MSEPTVPPEPEKLDAWLPQALLAVVLLAWSWLVRDHGFVWDDLVLIVQNELTGDLSRLPELLTADLWATTPVANGDSGYYRPLVLLSFALDRALFGLNPAPAHLHSVLWHGLATAGVLRLGRHLGLGALACSLAVLVYGLHPVQIEGVVFLAARNDGMATALLLWALATLLGRPVPGASRLLGGGLLVALACLSKESALLAPAAWLTLGWAAGRSRRTLGLGLLSTGAGVALALGARLLAGVGMPDRASLSAQLEALPTAAGWAVYSLFDASQALPGRTIACPDFEVAPLPWLLVGLLSAGLLAWAGRRRAVGALALAVGTWLPALAAVAQTGLAADRYLTLPLAGLGLAAGAALQRLLDPPRPGWAPPSLEGLVLLGLLGLGGLWGAATASLVGAWQDDRSLWTRALEARPTAYVHGGLARVYQDEGELDAAAALYARGVLQPEERAAGPASQTCWPLRHSCFNIVAIHHLRAAHARVQRAASGDPAARQALHEQSWDAHVDAVILGFTALGEDPPSDLARFGPPPDLTGLALGRPCPAVPELTGRLAQSLLLLGQHRRAADLARRALEAPEGDLSGMGRPVLAAAAIALEEPALAEPWLDTGPDARDTMWDRGHELLRAAAALQAVWPAAEAAPD